MGSFVARSDANRDYAGLLRVGGGVRVRLENVAFWGGSALRGGGVFVESAPEAYEAFDDAAQPGAEVPGALGRAA